MRILNIAPYIFVAGFCLLNTTKSQAQDNTSIVQDSRVEQLLAEKRKINSSIIVNDRYKIQIYYGDNDKARKALADFKRDFKTIDGTIVFTTPNYKVWVGNFKARIDAERALVEIKKKYPYALLIKPNR